MGDMSSQEGKKGFLIVGWACLILGTLFMLFSVAAAFPYGVILYGPFFTAALILSLITMAQGRVSSGVTLLILTSIIPATFFLLMFLLTDKVSWQNIFGPLQELTKKE